MKIIADCSNGMQVLGTDNRYTILDPCCRVIQGVRMLDAMGMEEALLHAVADKLGKSKLELHEVAQNHIQQAINALKESTEQRLLAVMKSKIGRPAS